MGFQCERSGMQALLLRKLSAFLRRLEESGRVSLSTLTVWIRGSKATSEKAPVPLRSSFLLEKSFKLCFL